MYTYIYIYTHGVRVKDSNGMVLDGSKITQAVVLVLFARRAQAHPWLFPCKSSCNLE